MKKLTALLPGTSTNSADQADKDNSASSPMSSSSNHSNKTNNSNSETNQTKSPPQVSPSRTLFPGHQHGVTAGPSSKHHHGAEKKYIANPNPNRYVPIQIIALYSIMQLIPRLYYYMYRGPANLALKHPFASTDTSDISKDNEPLSSELINEEEQEIRGDLSIPVNVMQHASSLQVLVVESSQMNYKQKAAQKKLEEKAEAERAAVYWKRMIQYGIGACVFVMTGCFGFFIYYAVKVMTGSL